MSLRAAYFVQGVTDAINSPHGTRSTAGVDSAVLQILFADPNIR